MIDIPVEEVLWAFNEFRKERGPHLRATTESGIWQIHDRNTGTIWEMVYDEESKILATGFEGPDAYEVPVSFEEVGRLPTPDGRLPDDDEPG